MRPGIRKGEIRLKIPIFIIFAIFLLASCNNTKKATEAELQQYPEANVQASPDTLEIRQIDGTSIHVVGYGNMFISYTETIDGYTIVTNDQGVYEYAKQTDDGDLKPDGIKVHDPGKRDKKELRHLKHMPKHLRYQSPKLDELIKRQHKWDKQR